MTMKPRRMRTSSAPAAVQFNRPAAAATLTGSSSSSPSHSRSHSRRSSFSDHTTAPVDKGTLTEEDEEDLGEDMMWGYSGRGKTPPGCDICEHIANFEGEAQGWRWGGGQHQPSGQPPTAAAVCVDSGSRSGVGWRPMRTGIKLALFAVLMKILLSGMAPVELNAAHMDGLILGESGHDFSSFLFAFLLLQHTVYQSVALRSCTC